MALGEWLSVQSSRELYMNQIKIEREEIESAPEEETEELSLIYQSRGLSLNKLILWQNRSCPIMKQPLRPWPRKN